MSHFCTQLRRLQTRRSMRTFEICTGSCSGASTLGLVISSRKPILLLGYTTINDHNVQHSKRALHRLLFHWFRIECYSTLLAPSRYEEVIYVIRVTHSTYGVAWNTGTCLYMIWTGLGCLLQCVNSIVWNKNTVNRAPVYCDICS